MRNIMRQLFICVAFAACAFHALYMDMGSMCFSAYKKHSEADWTEIHPRNARSRYATNYLVFYYVD